MVLMHCANSPEHSWFQPTSGGQFHIHCQCPKSWVPLCFVASRLSPKPQEATQLQADPTCEGRGINPLRAIFYKWETGVLINTPAFLILYWDNVRQGPCGTELHLLTVATGSSKLTAGFSTFFFSHFIQSFTSAPWNFPLSNLPTPNFFSQVVLLQKSK